jgi:hypothetical protein
MVGDDDLFNFYKWAIDNKRFNIIKLNNFIDSYYNNISNNSSNQCHNKICYYFGRQYENGYIRRCISESILLKKDYCQYYGDYTDYITDLDDCKKCKEPIGLQVRGCMLCKFFNICPKMCWERILFKEYNLSICPLKRIFLYLEDTPTIKDSYLEWNDKYGKDLYTPSS